jgi:hypothetical protein
MVLERRLPPAEADALMATVVAETQAGLAASRRAHGQDGTRDGLGRRGR